MLEEAGCNPRVMYRVANEIVNALYANDIELIDVKDRLFRGVTAPPPSPSPRYYLDELSPITPQQMREMRMSIRARASKKPG